MNTNALFLHSFIKIRRTWSFESETVGTIVKLLMSCFWLGGFVFIGFFLDKMIQQNDVNTNMLLMCFFLGNGAMEMLLKIIVEKKHYTNISPYITLPIKIWKLKIHNFICNLFKISNFINFIFFSTYFVKQIFVADYPVFNGLFYVCLIFGFELFHESLFNWFKSLNGLKSVISILIYFVFYIGVFVLVLSYFSKVEEYLYLINPLTLSLLVVSVWCLVWMFHSLQFNNERRNAVEDKTNSIVGSWRFSNMSVYTQLILKNFLRGKTLKSFICFFLMGVIWIVNGYVQENEVIKFMNIMLGLVFLLQVFCMFSQPILSYFSYYADGLSSLDSNYHNNLLRNHYKIHLIYSAIVAIIFAAVTQRFFLAATMFVLNISLFYFVQAFQNVFGGVRRINSNDLSTIKTSFNLPDILYTIVMFGLSFLCVYLENNIYYNISIICVCFVIFFKRNSCFNYISNKMKENKYVNLAKYRK